MSLTRWLKTPKGYVFLILSALLLIVALWTKDLNGIYHALIAVAVSVAADMIASRIAKRKRTLPDGAAITGLIVAMILSTAASWYIVGAASILAILSKYVLVFNKKAIFNPAAFGLLLSVFLFRTGQSWWGSFGDLPAWTIAFVLIGGYAVTSRVNKFAQVFSFLGTYFILLLGMGIFHIGDAVDALRPPFINASLFFALFMLTDPPTSPAKDGDQIVFGIVSALVGATVYALYGGLTYLFAGLLAGNLLHLLIKSASVRTVKPQERGVRKA